MPRLRFAFVINNFPLYCSYVLMFKVHTSHFFFLQSYIKSPITIKVQTHTLLAFETHAEWRFDLGPLLYLSIIIFNANVEVTNIDGYSNSWHYSW